MSCWCDGDDPGCETCHPTMRPEKRASLRRVKAAREELLRFVVEVDGGLEMGPGLGIAAECYRNAVLADRAIPWS